MRRDLVQKNDATIRLQNRSQESGMYREATTMNLSTLARGRADTASDSSIYLSRKALIGFSLEALLQG